MTEDDQTKEIQALKSQIDELRPKRTMDPASVLNPLFGRDEGREVTGRELEEMLEEAKSSGNKDLVARLQAHYDNELGPLVTRHDRGVVNAQKALEAEQDRLRQGCRAREQDGKGLASDLDAGIYDDDLMKAERLLRNMFREQHAARDSFATLADRDQAINAQLDPTPGELEHQLMRRFPAIQRSHWLPNHVITGKKRR